MSHAAAIKDKALQLGFDLVGITPAVPHSDYSFFLDWLSKGNAAGMAWLLKNKEKRGDPQMVLPGARSIISCAKNYYRGHPLSIDMRKEGHGWISNYAWGEDYHEVVLDLLKELEGFVRTLIPGSMTKAYTDTGPLLERSYAREAGLGWIGKNTCLINTGKGSFLFLGEVITTAVLDYDKPIADHCGTCTRCLDACPTQALTPGILDANRCLSYLTIEHRGEVTDPALKAAMGPHLVGCDICQDVCPWNRKAEVSGDVRFDPRPGNFHPELQSLEGLSQEEFSKRFKGSPIKRLKKEGLARNVSYASKI